MSCFALVAFCCRFPFLRRLRFMAKHMDADLLQLGSSSVPPAELRDVAVFRAAVAKFDKQVLS